MLKIREKVWPWAFGNYRIKAQAITLYPFIIYRSEKAKDFYRSHEMVHVEQVRRLGWLKFYASYLNESRKKGYFNNKYEVEARKHDHK